MKNIIRRPNNRWNELIAFISGLVGGIVIGRKVSEQDILEILKDDVTPDKDAENKPENTEKEDAKEK